MKLYNPNNPICCPSTTNCNLNTGKCENKCLFCIQNANDVSSCRKIDDNAGVICPGINNNYKCDRVNRSAPENKGISSCKWIWWPSTGGQCVENPDACIPFTENGVNHYCAWQKNANHKNDGSCEALNINVCDKLKKQKDGNGQYDTFVKMSYYSENILLSLEKDYYYLNHCDSADYFVVGTDSAVFSDFPWWPGRYQ